MGSILLSASLVPSSLRMLLDGASLLRVMICSKSQAMIELLEQLLRAPLHIVTLPTTRETL